MQIQLRLICTEQIVFHKGLFNTLKVSGVCSEVSAWIWEMGRYKLEPLCWLSTPRVPAQQILPNPHEPARFPQNGEVSDSTPPRVTQKSSLSFVGSLGKVAGVTQIRHRGT
eukprot:m.253803 g.253803  ORF g.253803 m.253803 type:complete len:111 (-) comp26527_c0_seq6:95-427(-)